MPTELDRTTLLPEVPPSAADAAYLTKQREVLIGALDEIVTAINSINAFTGIASTISVVPTGALTSNNVQAALEELQAEIGGGGYSDEQAQDAIGAMLLDTATIDLSYNDATPSLKADVKNASITAAMVAADVATQAELDAHAGTSHVKQLRQVVMYRTVDGGNDPVMDPATWVVYGPDGNLVSTVGTTTMGLQEAIDYAATTGMDLLVLGGTLLPTSQDPSIISCTDTIFFPPMQKGVVTFQSVTINIGGTPDVGIQFDSTMAFDFQWRGGQLVCGADTEIGMLFKPQNELIFDPAGPVITASRFQVPSTVMLHPDGICVRFDPDLANIGDGNVFEFVEPNGGAYGVQVLGDASNVFAGNTVRVYGAHAQTSFCVSVGINSTGAANIYGNHWEIECDPGSGGGGVDIWGQNDIFTITVEGDEGPGAVGIKLESTAAKNIIIATEINGTTPVQDSSSSGDNMLLIP